MADGIGPDDLFELAQELRDVIAESLDTIPTFTGLEDLHGAPEYRFVSPGPPVPECCPDGMLAVHVSPIASELARQGDAGAPKLNVPRLVATILRCVHEGDGDGDTYVPPTAAEQEVDARQLYADAWAIWNHVYNLIRANQFLTRCGRVRMVQLIAVARDGGCAGWQMAIDVELSGYEETIGT